MEALILYSQKDTSKGGGEKSKWRFREQVSGRVAMVAGDVHLRFLTKSSLENVTSHFQHVLSLFRRVRSMTWRKRAKFYKVLLPLCSPSGRPASVVSLSRWTTECLVMKAFVKRPGILPVADGVTINALTRRPALFCHLPASAPRDVSLLCFLLPGHPRRHHQKEWGPNTSR